MSVRYALTLSGDVHAKMTQILNKAKGLAVLVCGRRAGLSRHRLLAQRVIDHQDHSAAQQIENAARAGHTLVVAGVAEPGGDHPAAEAFARSWLTAGSAPHAYARVASTDGRIVADLLLQDGSTTTVESVNVVGHELTYWHRESEATSLPEFVTSHAQAFDEGTIRLMRKLSIGVVGASGTGSPVVEQLVRLGVGHLTIVDDDRVEARNVNRILNSTMEDVANARFKVDVLADAIERIGLGTRVTRVRENLWNENVVAQLAECDLVFGCMDTIDGRFLLNMLASYYLLPYFDVGVKLVSGAKGSVREICGTVNYVQPGRSSLLSRNLFTMPEVSAAGLRRTDPGAHAQQRADGYISGVVGHRPAVVSVNMFAAALAVDELLARIHPFRERANENFAAVTFSLASMELFFDREEGVCEVIGFTCGFGDTTPPLGLPTLGQNLPQ